MKYRYKKWAAITLQQRWRAKIACRQGLRQYMRVITAVITIQTALRKHQINQRYNSMKRGFVRLQVSSVLLLMLVAENFLMAEVNTSQAVPWKSNLKLF